MSQITIEGHDKAIAAGVWSRVNIKGKWNIELNSSPFSNKYNFIFTEQKDATHFALKWL